MRLVSFKPRAGGIAAKVVTKGFFTAANADQPAAGTSLVVQVGGACFSHVATKKID